MKKILMIILDGFGIREEEYGNAIKQANMECFNRLWNEYPHSVLEASGEYVGLPEGLFGNSEICHGIIGLGQKIKQRLTVISEEIKKENIKNNKGLLELASHVKQNDSVLHLMGLLSDGGVHSHINYILKLLPVLKEMGVKKLAFHVITDGRDTHFKSSMGYIKQLQNAFNEHKLGTIVSICGRYYAMDRDRKYEKTKAYYDLVVNGIGPNINDLEIAINNCYLKNITDEFLPPMSLIKGFRINDNDALLWINFRQDRATQILNAINNPEFDGFQNKVPNNLKVGMMFEQDDIKNIVPIFDFDEESLYPIGEYFSDLGLSQARIAETEKYSHVTKFFNCEKTQKFKGCDNVLVASPSVGTFDEAPLMSAEEVTKNAIKCLEKDYDFILVNYANPDMLGHTGNLQATITALKGLDRLLEILITNAEDNFYKVMILSDHGNADTMLGEGDVPITTHSLAPVPFIILDKHVILKPTGDLTMVAPTLLKYMDIAIPKDMKETKPLIIDDL